MHSSSTTKGRSQHTTNIHADHSTHYQHDSMKIGVDTPPKI